MDPDQLGRLIDRHAGALTLYARQWSDTPEDAVQDAFLTLSGLRVEPDNPAAWLFRAVRNAAINAGLAARRRRRHESAAASSSPPWFEPESEGAAIDPESVSDALRSLPVDRREVIVAHLWGGLTFEQIAALMGTSSSTAHRLYQSGLAALRSRLEVPCPTPNPRPDPT